MKSNINEKEISDAAYLDWKELADRPNVFENTAGFTAYLISTSIISSCISYFKTINGEDHGTIFPITTLEDPINLKFMKAIKLKFDSEDEE